MAMTDVRQLRSFQFEEAKSQKGSIQQTASVELLILNSTAPDFGEIKNDTNTWPNFFNRRIPQINDLENVGGIEFYVTRRRFEYYDSENEFAVKATISYDSKSEEDDGAADEPQGDDPDTWKRMTISTETVSVPLTNQGEDGNKGGIPACNSAGDPVDGLTEDRAVVRLVYNNSKVVNPNFGRLLEYTNKTNSTDFLGVTRRKIRCMGFTGDYDDKNQLWNVTVEFLFDPNRHVVKYFDAGFNEIVGGKRRAITDILGNPVSKPVPLDGNGVAVDPAAIGLGNSAGNTQTLTVYPYNEIDMTNLISECRI